MVNNTTLIGLDPRQSVTDESIGAMIFIVVVLIWYSSSIVFLMVMQIGRSNGILDHRTDRSSKLFVQNFRDQNNHKEILGKVMLMTEWRRISFLSLEQLVDKQKRDKLWDIYLGTSPEMREKLTHAETLRIRHIEKTLANMNTNRRGSDPIPLDHGSPVSAPVNPWSSVVNVSSTSPQLRPRRRSSLDRKILEDWKRLADELRLHESWPWTIQKLFIRRHLRRQRHATEY